MTPLERLLHHCIPEPNSGCWLWLGRVSTQGYGLVQIYKDNKKTRINAHRRSWELHVGPVPDDIQVCHHCDNPPCVNPDHLFLGTARDNMQDCIQKGRHWTIPHPGETHGRVKLTEEQAREIKFSTARQVDLARKFGVTGSTVHSIRTGKNWKHLQGEPQWVAKQYRRKKH